MERDNRIYSQEERDTLIKRETTKLKKLFKDLDKATMDTVSSLISNAAFMAVTLYELQQIMNTKGTVSEYQNGENQWGTKKSPEVEIYNSMIKNHMNIIKQLTDLLPKAIPPEAGDDFEDFIKAK